MIGQLLRRGSLPSTPESQGFLFLFHDFTTLFFRFHHLEMCTCTCISSSGSHLCKDHVQDISLHDGHQEFIIAVVSIYVHTGYAKLGIQLHL